MREKLVVVVMGVAGCGKSTLARALASHTGLPFLEADDFHSDANRTRMAQGIALTDEDRWPWLDALGTAMAGAAATHGGAVATCSALRRVYRDRLRDKAGRVLFIHLTAERGELHRRIGQRPDHFMPTSLLDSQLATLEPPHADEWVLTLNATHSPDALVEAALAALA